MIGQVGFWADKLIGSGLSRALGGVEWHLHSHSTLSVQVCPPSGSLHPGWCRLQRVRAVSGTTLGSRKYLDR